MERLKQDFYIYEVEASDTDIVDVVKLNIFKQNELNKKKDIIFKDGPVVRMCHKTKSAKIFYEEIERLHEVSYLYIHSILGKKLDLRGLHRIHASSVSFENDQATLFVGASGVGKSHLAYFLDGETLSDDTIFLDAKGNVYPLLTRRGFCEKRDIKITSEEMYSLKRYEYGDKFLIPIKKCSKHKVYKLSEVYLLKKSHRVLMNSSNFFKNFYYFFMYELIGIGTPQIFEFFWEPGIRDFFIKVKIFFLRLRLFFTLIKFSNIQLLRTNQTSEVLSLFATNSRHSYSD
jgi:hypothetical protein